MRFGTRVLVRRGSTGHPPGDPGCDRLVKGVMIGGHGHAAIVRLTEDDPLATVGYCLHAGDVGWWSRSAIRADEGCDVLPANTFVCPEEILSQQRGRLK